MVNLMKDVNGGYRGLMIILSAFMIQFIAFGITLSIGIYNIEFLAITGDAFAVSLVSAINTGVFLGSGPLASLLMNHMNHRSVVLIGAALSSASMICMPFLPSIEYMYAIFGVGAGLGFCLVYVPSHVMSGLYYDKHQSLATGLATAGSGLGMSVFPSIVANLIEIYTWRPSLFILAGITLNLFVFALLLRPLPKTKDKKQSNETEIMLQEKGEQEPIAEVKEKPLKHFYVFCSFNFDVYFISNTLWNMGLNMVVMFGPDFLTTKGLTNMEAAYMLTILGFCTFLGSVLSGAIGNIRCMSRLFLYVMLCSMCAVSVVCLTFFNTYSVIVITHIFIGLTFGGILGLLVVLTTDLLGAESLGDGLGYLMLANGVGCFAGPPVAGVLKDKLGTYDVAFYTAGILLLVSGFMMVLIPVWNRFCGQPTRRNPWEMEIEIAQGS